MDAPVNMANRLSTAADDKAASGNFLGAIEDHFAAAAKYLEAITDNTDSGAAKTLKQLAASNQKKARDLQKRLEIKKRQAEAAASAPSPTSVAAPTSTAGTSSSPLRETSLKSPVNSPAVAGKQKEKEKEREKPQTPDKHPEVIEVHDLGDGDFSQEGNPDSDHEGSDSFHKFWDALEKLVEKLPLGVAFAVAHQAKEKPQIVARDFADPVSNSIMLDSYFVVSDEAEANKKMIADLQRENAQLREQVATLTKNESMQQMMKENDFLRSSIINFKQNVAQMKNSALTVSTAGGRPLHHLAKSDLAFAQGRHGSLDGSERMRQLELENQKLRTENANLNEKVNELREKWKKLRESAKKIKSSQSQSQSQTQSGSMVSSGTPAPEGTPESVFYSVANN